MYQLMLAAGMQPNTTTYNALVSAYSKAGQLDKVGGGILIYIDMYRWIYASMSKDQGSFGGGVILVPWACSKRMTLRSQPLRVAALQVMEVFQDMVRAGCERSVITYSALISAAEKAGQWELALGMFNRMAEDGVRCRLGQALLRGPARGSGMAWSGGLGPSGGRPLWDGVGRGGWPEATGRGCSSHIHRPVFIMQVRPNTITFNSLLAALGQGRPWDACVMLAVLRQGCLRWFGLTKHTNAHTAHGLIPQAPSGSRPARCLSRCSARAASQTSSRTQ